MLLSLALPVVVLMFAAVCVTRLVELFMPETLMGLVWLAVLSSLGLWAISAGLFVGLYHSRDAQVTSLLGQGEGLQHMLRLGARASVIWLPMILICVVTAPRRWRKNVW